MDSSTGSPVETDSRGPRRPFLAMMTVLAAGLFLVWGIGQCLRDFTWYTALCFYVPSPFVGVAMLLQCGWLRWRHRSRTAAILLLLALFPLGFVALSENQWSAPQRAAPEAGQPRLRIVHWNTWYAQRGWEPVLQRLEALQADIYILSEAPRGFNLESAARTLGPAYVARRFEDMAVFARGDINVHERHSIGRHGWSRLLDWNSPGGLLRILAVDFPSHPRTHRAPLLQELRRQMERLQPDLVVGDLNAPRCSPGLRELPAGYQHAYVAAGSGWSYSWPVICPLWAIDQCIAGPRITPLHYELQSTLSSDHRLQLCDFAFARQNATPGPF